MGLNDNYYSDYGSASSSNSTSSWGGAGVAAASVRRGPQRQSSLQDQLQRTCSADNVCKRSLEEVMNEFRMNGSDSPYDPDEDRVWGNFAAGQLSGMGPAGGYLRQKSWPAPEASPAPPPPRPHQQRPRSGDWADFCSVTSHDGYQDSITPEQLRVLQSLPGAVVLALLRDLEQARETRGRRRAEECRFCKNNGERELYYRSHVLRDAAGRVRCPVLRAFVCKRCGASGDHAHTIKYCPLSTDEERIQSAAMMRSVRMASGRKRTNSTTAPSSALPSNDYNFEPATPSAENHNYVDWSNQPLDPVWAALEQKLNCFNFF
ncbi:hypothetical protein JYU34_011589 [Plutella xylostella]|uniref:Nanos-type domain-containing protein n=1 Tax=Plutella xylostella TaxID=51655 RepID=A0ABQ7QII5_PLUXY|nr:hypothetical protein JYU34_011589 [Plutella xylostella]